MAKPFRGVIAPEGTSSVLCIVLDDVSGAPFVELAAEARMAFMRD